MDSIKETTHQTQNLLELIQTIVANDLAQQDVSLVEEILANCCYLHRAEIPINVVYCVLVKKYPRYFLSYPDILDNALHVMTEHQIMAYKNHTHIQLNVDFQQTYRIYHKTCLTDPHEAYFFFEALLLSLVDSVDAQLHTGDAQYDDLALVLAHEQALLEHVGLTFSEDGLFERFIDHCQLGNRVREHAKVKQQLFGISPYYAGLCARIDMYINNLVP